jgi:serine/threonine protein phosphatase PrpC
MAASDSNAGVHVTIVGLTDVGRVREHNEDAFLVMDRTDGRRLGNGERLQLALDDAAVFAVADGMGGAAAGEVASQMASDRLAKVLGSADYTESTPDQISSLMDTAIHSANEEILTEARENAERKGMGTTLTAAVAVPGRVYISQVGDSRGYLLRKGKLVQLTKDQSLIGQLIEEGTLTEEEAEKLGGKNIVLQAVGVEENLRVDTKHWEVLRGDVILLCSDGLTGMVKDADLEVILNECGDDLGTALERMVDAANENGGRDNITVVLARFGGEGLRAPMEALAEGGVERAGAGFAAPPPPEVPNPMKKVGGALLAIIALIVVAFFALQRTTTDLTVSWKPADVGVHLTLQDADGNEVRAMDASGGSALLDGLAPGVYQVAASAPGYFEGRKELTFEVAGDAAESLWLVPKPGALKIRVATPHVTISVEAEGSGAPGVEPFTESFPWPDPATPKRYERGIPAGPVRVRVAREGFAPRESTQELAPEGALTFDVEALEETRGALRVRAPAEDFAVVVVDAFGDELGRGTTDASGELRLEVRVGRHEVRAEKEGFADFRAPVEVTEGGEAELTVEARVQAVAATVFGAPGTLFRVERADGDGWMPVGQLRRIADSGQYSRPIDLAPGSYRVVWDDDKVQEFEVRAGEAGKQLRLE